LMRAYALARETWTRSATERTDVLLQ
jgi:hypothetical protein